MKTKLTLHTKQKNTFTKTCLGSVDRNIRSMLDEHCLPFSEVVKIIVEPLKLK